MAASLNGLVTGLQDLGLSETEAVKMEDKTTYSWYTCPKCEQSWYANNCQSCKLCCSLIFPYKESKRVEEKNTTCTDVKGEEDQHQNGSVLLAWYKCTDCKKEWSFTNVQECINCPFEVYPRKQIGNVPKNKMFFGWYDCPACKRTWRSAYSWVDYYQECKSCSLKVYPEILTPLIRKEVDDDDLSKPHEIELCGKCQKLGHLCREPRDA